METKEYIFAEGKVKAQLSAMSGKGGVTEYHLMLHVSPEDRYEEQLQYLLEAYRKLTEELQAVPVFTRYFLSDAANQTTKLEEAIASLSCGVISIIQQRPLDGSKIAMWSYLATDIKAISVEPLAFRHNGYTHFWYGRFCAACSHSEAQTMALFTIFQNDLEADNLTLANNCIRTWLFVQNVDVNYAGVVSGRRKFFERKGLTKDTHYIASTGIEGRVANPNALIQMDAYAIDGLQKGQIQYLYALTHLSPTYVYNVTFERGTSIIYGDRRHHYISGTASIDNKGDVLHVGDVEAQTLRMWENIEKLLEEGGASMDDIVSGIVYLRDPSDYARIRKMFDRKFPNTPLVFVYAPVCRPTWLIEMECIAISGNGNAEFNDF